MRRAHENNDGTQVILDPMAAAPSRALKDGVSTGHTTRESTP